MFFENKINIRGNRGSNQEWTHATLGTETKRGAMKNEHMQHQVQKQRPSKHRKLNRGKGQTLPKKKKPWVNQDSREG